MSEAILHYFPGRGRAEIIRLVLEFCGVSYRDQFVETVEEFDALNRASKLWFNQIPCLEMDGQTLVQVRPILSYLAANHNLLPSSTWQRYQAEAIIAATFDCLEVFFGFVFSRIEPEFVHQRIQRLCDNLFSRLATEKPLLGDEFSLADLCLFHYLKETKDRGFAHPRGFEKQYCWYLNEPKINEYVRSGRRMPPPSDDYVKLVRTILRTRTQNPP